LAHGFIIKYFGVENGFLLDNARYMVERTIINYVVHRSPSRN